MLRRPLLATLILLALPPGTALAQVTCQGFFDQQLFSDYCASHGLQVLGLETFEESTIPPQGLNCVLAPLGPDPRPNFPTGLNQRNILILDNVWPGPAPPTVNPSGDLCGLVVYGAGFNGSSSSKVGEGLYFFQPGVTASLDLIFTVPAPFAVGFKLSRFQGYPFGGWAVTAYDAGGLVLQQFDVPAPATTEPFSEFFGISCDQLVARINIFDRAGAAADAIDDIIMWEEIPVPVRPSSWGRMKLLYR